MQSADEILLKLFSNILKVSISIEDNFYDKGGDSLAFSELIHKINKTFFTSIRLKHLLPFEGNISEIIEFIKTEHLVNKTMSS
jgi:acyl carrier protein